MYPDLSVSETLCSLPCMPYMSGFSSCLAKLKGFTSIRFTQSQLTRNNISLSNNYSQCLVTVHPQPCWMRTTSPPLLLLTINLLLLTASIWSLHIATLVHLLWVWEGLGTYKLSLHALSLICKQEQEMQRSTFRRSDKDVKLVLPSPDWQATHREHGCHCWGMWECDLTRPCIKMILFSVLTNYLSEMTLVPQRPQQYAKTAFRGAHQCSSASQPVPCSSNMTWL